MRSTICILLLLGFAFAIEPENVEENIQNALNEHGLGEINKTEIFEKAKKLLQTKCDKSGGGNAAYEGITGAIPELQSCIEARLNASNIEEELNEAKKTGSMDEVFGKYCNKTPVVKQCITDFNNKLELCLEAEERNGLKTFMNITENVIDFFCIKDGDKMAMFIAEGGQECISEKRDEIQNCINKTLSHRMDDINKVIEDVTGDNVTLPLLVFNSEYCLDYDNFHECTVDKLESCKDNTPANLIDAMFKYIRRSIPCKEPPKIRSRLRSSSSSVISSFLTVLLGVVVTFRA